jgi:CrcB protein
MTEVLIVGAGGAFGSIARYALGKKIAAGSNSGFPVETFIINVSGAFLLGIVISIPIPHSLYLLFADGFLGAYTTFSTFMAEGFSLWKNNNRLNALTYVLGSLLLGLAGITAGIFTVKWVGLLL